MLCKLLGGDKGKVNDNDLLRPPGTINRKPTVRGGEPAPVRWLIAPNLRRLWKPRELYDFLQVAVPQTFTTTMASSIESIDIEHLPERVRRALTKPAMKPDGVTVDRSATTFAVFAAAQGAGLTFEEGMAAVRTRADLAQRLDERPAGDEDPVRIWMKIDSKRRQEIRQRDPGGLLPERAPEVPTSTMARPTTT